MTDAEVGEEIQLRELNAALVSFYANAHQRGSTSYGAALVRTIPLAEAAERVMARRGAGAATPRVAEAAERARCHGLGALVTAALSPAQRVPAFDLAIRRLAGADYPAVAHYIDSYTDGDGDGVGDRADRQHAPMTRARLIASLLVGSVRGAGGDVKPDLRLAGDSLHPTPPGMRRPPGRVPPVTLDPTSMVTTVPAQGHYYGDLAEMAPYLDPRSWSETAPEFWVTSRRVRREGGRFVPLDVGGFDPPLGQSWSGLFEEKMVLCFEGGILSGFTNHLSIRFEAKIDRDDPMRSRVWVGFSLYQCESSVQLMRLAPSGMDVDEGYAYYWQGDERVPERRLGAPPREGDATVWCECVKRVRYTDMLSRRTQGQGTAGAGEVMNYLAPGGLGLWLDNVIAGGPYAAMSRAAKAKGGAVAPTTGAAR